MFFGKWYEIELMYRLRIAEFDLRQTLQRVAIGIRES